MKENPIQISVLSWSNGQCPFISGPPMSMAGVVTMVQSTQLMADSSCKARDNMLEKYMLRKYFLPSERQTATEWLTALHTGYQQSALNCWIAALLYLVTLAVAAHQLWSNQQAAEQFKVHSNCVLTVLSVPLQFGML